MLQHGELGFVLLEMLQRKAELWAEEEFSPWSSTDAIAPGYYLRESSKIDNIGLGNEKMFSNLGYSSFCNAIERAFGVVKWRFQIVIVTDIHLRFESNCFRC